MPVPTGPWPAGRLAARILTAFHLACDEAEFGIAAELLRLLEQVVTRPAVPVDKPQRRARDALVAAHERLWRLRHPDPGS